MSISISDLLDYVTDQLKTFFPDRNVVVKKDNFTKKDELVYDLIKRIEIPRQWYKELYDYCEEKGIVFLSTPFDLNAVHELEAVVMKKSKIEGTIINFGSTYGVQGNDYTIYEGTSDQSYGFFRN